MPTPDVQLGALESMLGGDAPLPTTTGETVMCRVCRSTVDAVSGSPVSPVGNDNVNAVRQFMSDAGQAELGGQQLGLGGA